MTKGLWRRLLNKVVDGRYHLKEILGVGGFGAVFLASEVVNDRELRKVALKMISPSNDIDKEKQFQELEHGMQLTHHHLVTCYSVGSDTINNVEFLYMAMELAECSLKDYLSDKKILSEEETIKIIKDIALGLKYVHEKHNLAHRDIKPENIFKFDDVWKIGDFGIARELGANTMAQSRAFGSAYYAPPECYKDNEISLAWDIWSLGVMICKCCGGELPYTASSDPELMNKILNQPPNIPNSMPKSLKNIVINCLDKDRKKRWKINEIISQLSNIANKKTPDIIAPPLSIKEDHIPIQFTPKPTTIINVTNPKSSINIGLEDEFIQIPDGIFLFGENKKKIHLPKFEISKYPVTVSQYRTYCHSKGIDMPKEPSWGWQNDHPMVNINWDEAKAFCDFYKYRLPTEQEWEKAARGTDGREYPWGDDWDENNCANSSNTPNSTPPVGSYPKDISPFGCMDMAGNVREWTNSWYDIENDIRVLRGCAWRYESKPINFTCSFRSQIKHSTRSFNIGFRVVR